MVRVISVHNFPKQDVTGVDDIVAAAVAPPNKLLLAQKNHSVLIKHASDKEDSVLPTVDQPVSVHYSTQGNYIATLEARGEVRFVRVYLGWGFASGTAPLRARIAGRVTPLSQQCQGGIEMLEVPTPAMPDVIAVCPFSGNLLVCSQGRLSVFEYTVKVHDISRVQFADLFKTNWNLELGFIPDGVRLCEDLIAAYNERFLVVLRVTTALSNKETGSAKGQTSCNDVNKSGAIDYNKLIESSSASSYDCNFRCQEFPSVAAEPHLRLTPFLTFTDFSPRITHDSPAKEQPLDVERIISLQLAPCMVGSTVRREVADAFTCLVLRPYYHAARAVPADARPVPVPVLGSPYYSQLRAIACFFGTQQEGYLHHYNTNNHKSRLVCVYPLTAPLMNAVLEDSLLHALTEAGLETYTLRSPVDTQLQDHGDPICLLGLRPFVHVRRLLLGAHALFLLASQDTGAANQEPGPGWTVYELALADPAALWGDFLAAAEENQWEAPSTYSHLVREANLILQTRRESLQFELGNATSEEASTLVDTLYRQSCALLGDYYLLHGPCEEASKLFRLSELKLPEVIKRGQTLLDKVPASHREEFQEAAISEALVFHAKQCLKIEDERYRSYGGNREEFYSPDIASLVAVVLDLIEKFNPKDVSEAVLASPVIQQFSSDRSLQILATLVDPQPADLLALALMYIQKGQNGRGVALLASLDHLALEPLLLSHHDVLLEREGDSLSELALAFLNLNPKFLAAILTGVTTEKNLIPFEKVQKMMMRLLQNGGTASKNGADVLEWVVERQLEYLAAKKDLHCAGAKEAFNTLTWLYLTQLSQRKQIQDGGLVLFKEARPKYLDLLPPIGPDLSQVLSPQHMPSPTSSEEPKNVLLKLQALLASDVARDSLFKVRVLLSQTPKVFGSLSIQIQCAAPQEAAQLLVNFAPQALLAYLKESSLDETSWRNVLDHIQTKISSAQDSKRKFYYEQLLCNVLEHLAVTLPLEAVAELLPSSHPGRSQYLRLAYNHEQAKQIRALIMMTGSQLL